MGTKQKIFHPPVQLLQYRPGCLIIFSMSFDRYIGNNPGRNHLLPPVEINKKYTGILNWKSISKLRFSINLLVAQSVWKEVFNPTSGRWYKFKINFITLTLSAPQKNVSDRIIKSRMLEPFIRNMRNVYQLGSYVWRAERQKNGNIHFHITCDTFISYDKIRDAWNYQQSKYHFIDDFRNKNKTEFPNSTDVHAVHTIKELAAYLTKYMSKAESMQDVIEGKVWDCSKNLKVKGKPTFEITAADYDWINDMFEINENAFTQTEFCTIIRLSDKKLTAVIPEYYNTEYNSWLSVVRSNARKAD